MWWVVHLQHHVYDEWTCFIFKVLILILFTIMLDHVHMQSQSFQIISTYWWRHSQCYTSLSAQTSVPCRGRFLPLNPQFGSRRDYTFQYMSAWPKNRGAIYVYLFSMYSRGVYCVCSCRLFVILSDGVFISACTVLCKMKALSCVTLGILFFSIALLQL